MNEKNELHNRNLHISGLLNEEKVDIGDIKVDIENEKINTDKTIKANFYSLVARMETLDKGMASEETYKNYLQDLYWYNSGMFRKLNRVYALVEKAVMQIYFIFLCHSLLRIKRQIQFFFKQWQPLCCDS